MPTTFTTSMPLNLKSMALFVCNLYISGQFGTVQFIFDSTMLNNQLIIDLNFNCPVFIPILTARSTGAQFPLSSQSKRTDQILQIILLDRYETPFGPKNITDRLKDYIAFYQIYVAPVAGVREDLIRNLEKNYVKDDFSNALLLVHNSSSGTNEMYSRENLNEPINLTNQNSMENIFAETFGKLESFSILGVLYSHGSTCHNEYESRRYVFAIYQRFLTNYYAARLNISFLEGASTICEGGTQSIYVRNHPQSEYMYKELFFEMELLDNKTM